MQTVKVGKKVFELTQEQAEYRNSIDKLKQEQLELSKKQFELNRKMSVMVDNCNHSFVKIHELPYCFVCDTKFNFWWCDESPTKYCQYDEDDINEDCCIYCHAPSERK